MILKALPQSGLVSSSDVASFCFFSVLDTDLGSNMSDWFASRGWEPSEVLLSISLRELRKTRLDSSLNFC